MTSLPNKIQWHPAFYAAMELELRENLQELHPIPEYVLGKEPVRMDLLLINKDSRDEPLKNEIGHIMRKYNIIE